MLNVKKVLVVAPHPDDETFGLGATILKHIAEGHQVHWLIMTTMSVASGYSVEQISQRQNEIELVAESYQFSSYHQLAFDPAQLDAISISCIIDSAYPYIQKLKPEILYLPFRGDVHSDHQVTFDALVACSKAFRAPFVERILAYETLSETDYILNPNESGFKPNVWCNVSAQIAKKLEIISIYQSELAEFPFPRSIEAIEALAKLRGVQCGVNAAEAFMLLKEINR